MYGSSFFVYYAYINFSVVCGVFQSSDVLSANWPLFHILYFL